MHRGLFVLAILYQQDFQRFLPNQHQVKHQSQFVNIEHQKPNNRNNYHQYLRIILIETNAALRGRQRKPLNLN